tara:strand:- start:1050 stop:2033 length:984 start_codon:yes stop_codon:yes gene_type:complete
MPTITDLEDIRTFRQQRVPLDNLEYSDGNVKSVKLPVENVIDRIECTLSFDWTSDTGTLKSPKGLGLIRWLTLRAAGTNNVMRIPGRFLQYLHQQYYRKAPYASHPGTSSSGTAVYHFTLPINAATAEMGGASAASMLDLSRTNGTLEIDWGNKSDIWSAGTNTVSNVLFKSRVMQSTAVKTGLPGTVGYPDYLLHLITTDEQSITATNSAVRVDLTENHIFNRITIMTDTDDNATNDILNSVSYMSGESTHQKLERDEMLHENYSRYAFTQLETGLYVADIATNGQWQQMLSFLSSQRFRLSMDVTKPGSGSAHRAYVIYDRFIKP